MGAGPPGVANADAAVAEPVGAAAHRARGAGGALAPRALEPVVADAVAAVADAGAGANQPRNERAGPIAAVALELGFDVKVDVAPSDDREAEVAVRVRNAVREQRHRKRDVDAVGDAEEPVLGHDALHKEIRVECCFHERARRRRVVRSLNGREEIATGGRDLDNVAVAPLGHEIVPHLGIGWMGPGGRRDVRKVRPDDGENVLLNQSGRGLRDRRVVLARARRAELTEVVGAGERVRARGLKRKNRAAIDDAVAVVAAEDGARIAVTRDVVVRVGDDKEQVASVLAPADLVVARGGMEHALQRRLGPVDVSCRGDGVDGALERGSDVCEREIKIEDRARAAGGELVAGDGVAVAPAAKGHHRLVQKRRNAVARVGDDPRRDVADKVRGDRTEIDEQPRLHRDGAVDKEEQIEGNLARSHRHVERDGDARAQSHKERVRPQQRVRGGRRVDDFRLGPDPTGRTRAGARAAHRSGRAEPACRAVATRGQGSN
eukprot:Amastigsp_a512812_15.p2 type:complete len:491 gc:universal Amastigsp_a512812_15:1533-61(-)